MDAGQITIMPTLPTSPVMISVAASTAEVTKAENTVDDFGSLFTKAILGFDTTAIQASNGGNDSSSTKEILGNRKSTDGLKSEQTIPENSEQTTEASSNQFSLLQIQLTAAQPMLPTLQQTDQNPVNSNNEMNQTLDIRTITSVSEQNSVVNNTALTGNKFDEVSSRISQTSNTIASNAAPSGEESFTATTSTKTLPVETKPSGQVVATATTDTKTVPLETKPSVQELSAKNTVDINAISESSSQKLSSGSTNIKTELAVITPDQMMISDDKTLKSAEPELQRVSNQSVQVGFETPLTKVSVAAQIELQQAVEMQSVSQEIPTGTKNSSTSMLTPQISSSFTDVTTASADTPGHGESSSDSEQQQGTQTVLKTAKLNTTLTENIVSDPHPEISSSIDQNDQQVVNHQLRNHLSSMQIDDLSAEAPKIIVPEQIGRQVLERLGSHEIRQGNDQITFKLSPENLGNLQLTMRMEDQRLRLEIVAENREVRNALLTQADDLKESLARQNIKMDSFDVTTSNGGNLSQQSRNWKNGSSEYQPYQPTQYASRQATASGIIEAPLRYFATQYQSTIDVRF